MTDQKKRAEHRAIEIASRTLKAANAIDEAVRHLAIAGVEVDSDFEDLRQRIHDLTGTVRLVRSELYRTHDEWRAYAHARSE